MTPIEIYAMLQRKINEGGYGSPLVASLAENMTDQNRVYVYTGSETGMETGHWYYYDGEDWADGGVYNAVAVQTDKTLTQEDKAADGKATGDAINQLKSDLNELNSNFADIESDGVVPSAEQILTDKGITDSVPYHYRATGGNGADREYVDAVVGGTVNWNQLASTNAIQSQTSSGVTFTLNSDGSYSISGTATGRVSTQANVIGRFNATKGHKYYIGLSSDISPLRFRAASGLSYGLPTKSTVVDCTADTNMYFSFDSLQAISDTLNITKLWINIFDLTAMFGTEIADYIYNLEQSTAGAGVTFFRKLFPNDYYEYNAGGLVSVSGLSAHKMVGFNQWDGTYEVGKWIADYVTGQIASQATYNVTDYIPVLPNTEYYKRDSGTSRTMFYDSAKNAIPMTSWEIGSNHTTFMSPPNAAYIRFSITDARLATFWFNLSDPAKNGTYEPYKAHSYPLDSSLTLRGIPKIVDGKMCFDGDTYDADGTVTRKYGIVDLGTLDWAVYPGYEHLFYDKSEISVKLQANSTTPINAVCDKYIVCTEAACGAGAYTNGYFAGSASNTKRLYIADTNYTDAATFKAAMSGVYLVYELATPTTESADPYQHLQQCDPNGTEEYVSTGIVPIGHNSFYPENLRAKVEQLPWNFANLIAPTESTFTATRNYTTGALFIVDNVLYKATSNIANGGAITPNTNCTATTLAEIISVLA